MVSNMIDSAILSEEEQRYKSLFTALSLARSIDQTNVISSSSPGSSSSPLASPHQNSQQGSVAPSRINAPSLTSETTLQYMYRNEDEDREVEALEAAFSKAASGVAYAAGGDADRIILGNTPLLFPPFYSDKDGTMPQREMSGAFSQIVKFKKKALGAGGSLGAIPPGGGSPGDRDQFGNSVNDGDKRPNDLLPKIPMAVIVVGSIALVCVFVALGFVIGRKTTRRQRLKRQGKEEDRLLGAADDMKRKRAGGGVSKGKRKGGDGGGGGGVGAPPSLDLIRRSNTVSRWAASISGGQQVTSNGSFLALSSLQGRRRRRVGRRFIRPQPSNSREDDIEEEDSSFDDDELESGSVGSVAPPYRSESVTSTHKHRYEASTRPLSHPLPSTSSAPSSRQALEPSAPPLAFSLWDYVLGSAPPPQYPTEEIVPLDGIGVDAKRKAHITEDPLAAARREDSTRSKRSDDDPENDFSAELVTASPYRPPLRPRMEVTRHGSSTSIQSKHRQMSLQKKEHPSTPLPQYPPLHALLETAPLQPTAPEWEVTSSPTSMSMPAPPPAYTSIRSGAPRSDVYRVADGGGVFEASAPSIRGRTASVASSASRMSVSIGEWEGIPAWTIEEERRVEMEEEGVERRESEVLRILESLPEVGRPVTRNRRHVVPSSPKLISEAM